MILSGGQAALHIWLVRLVNQVGVGDYFQYHHLIFSAFVCLFIAIG